MFRIFFFLVFAFLTISASSAAQTAKEALEQKEQTAQQVRAKLPFYGVSIKALQSGKARLADDGRFAPLYREVQKIAQGQKHLERVMVDTEEIEIRRLNAGDIIVLDITPAPYQTDPIAVAVGRAANLMNGGLLFYRQDGSIKFAIARSVFARIGRFAEISQKYGIAKKPLSAGLDRQREIFVEEVLFLNEKGLISRAEIENVARKFIYQSMILSGNREEGYVYYDFEKHQFVLAK